ncbi:unnamed protein product [Periconia digitata]|uniref:Uncharacterized protein n=1 Tax=Periconia digitata TaxID=1303443 RepID=A0A9W4XIW8_9PLEO|nr:unnamed protein product [Periconia digitata]
MIKPANKGDVDPETQQEVDFEADLEPYKLTTPDPSVDGIPGLEKKHLNDRTLKFQNKNRPSKRFLFVWLS